MNDKEVLERFQKNIKIMEKLSFIELVAVIHQLTQKNSLFIL